MDIENLQQYDEHLKLLFGMHDTYKRKNHDYGNSFTDLYKEFGLISPVIKLQDKLSRLKTLCKKEALVSDESIDDTLLDMACYAVMTILERQKGMAKIDYSNFDYSTLPPIVAIDFDGTLFTGKPFPEIGEINQNLVDEIWNGRYKDYKKILWTHRSGKTLEDALIVCDKKGLIFDAVNENIKEVKEALNGGPCMKIWYNVFIDDKTWNPIVDLGA